MLLLKETLRKSIHLSSLIIPFGYRYVLGFNRKLMFYIILAAFIIMLIVEFHRFWQKGFRKTFWWMFGLVLRKHELRDFTGATYLLFAAVICVAFFEPNIAFCAMAFLSLGDTFAAMVGINFGKRKFAHSNKSLEGSIACFAVCFIFGLIYAEHPLIAFTGAGAATLAELSNLPVDDNVEMPLAAALAMTITKVFI
ncbi:MAG: phosphatidate cytidylyltransferase [Candidatus Syntrophosphaera sp.]|nr:phosphatidate cytidylyltransferase [Candidatus Syntrophosphaera sp.]